MSLDDVDGLGTGEPMRIGGEVDRAGDVVLFIERRDETVSTVLGDVGPDADEKGFGLWTPVELNVLVPAGRPREGSRLRFGPVSKVANASSNVG